jgi:hypothetical protein
MTNNKQQTAVEWLAEQMEILHYDYWAEHISKDEKNQRLKQLKEQAKEMEKEKAIKLYIDYRNYLHEEFKHQNGGQAVILSFREFYEQTYGGGEQ